LKALWLSTIPASVFQAMANLRKPMFQIRRLLELKVQGKSKRKIAKVLGLSRNTVQNYLNSFENHFVNLSELLTWSDEALDRFIRLPKAPVTAPDVAHAELYKLFEGYPKELAKTGVSRYTLWMEYRKQHPQGLKYSHFCTRFRTWQGAQKTVMHLEHKAGEKLFVDFAGKKLYLTSPLTGEVTPVEFFVATLPCSQLCFALALRSQQKADFVEALRQTFEYLGGVPQSIVPDNLKAAVTKADRYEPEVNQPMEEFASHYKTCFLPARAGKPKDKALVESAVNILYGRIYAPLRNRVFHTLAELNQAIRELLDEHNQLLFQGKDYSRRSYFESVEKQMLLPLPNQHYQLRSFSFGKVHPNCHVLLKEDKHHYSVPYYLTGKQVKFIYTDETVEIYHPHKRMAVHVRNLRKYGYSTQKEHLPANQQWVSEWSVEYFVERASRIGSSTRLAMEDLLSRRPYPEHAYKSCAGVLSLEKKYGKDRLEKACDRALLYQATSYRLICTILEKELDRLPADGYSVNPKEERIILHENIRGALAYQ
jgi:transposase